MLYLLGISPNELANDILALVLPWYFGAETWKWAFDAVVETNTTAAIEIAINSQITLTSLIGAINNSSAIDEDSTHNISATVKATFNDTFAENDTTSRAEFISRLPFYSKWEMVFEYLRGKLRTFSEENMPSYFNDAMEHALDYGRQTLNDTFGSKSALATVVANVTIATTAANISKHGVDVEHFAKAAARLTDATNITSSDDFTAELWALSDFWVPAANSTNATAAFTKAKAIARSLDPTMLHKNSLDFFNTRLHATQLTSLGVGYCIFIGALFLAACITYSMSAEYIPFGAMLQEGVEHVVLALKVSGLTVLEMVIFPTLIGCALDVLTLDIRGGTFEGNYAFFKGEHFCDTIATIS
jgi:hypothetical protein